MITAEVTKSSFYIPICIIHDISSKKLVFQNFIFLNSYDGTVHAGETLTGTLAMNAIINETADKSLPKKTALNIMIIDNVYRLQYINTAWQRGSFSKVHAFYVKSPRFSLLAPPVKGS